jgi:hypothetical protein
MLELRVDQVNPCLIITEVDSAGETKSTYVADYKPTRNHHVEPKLDLHANMAKSTEILSHPIKIEKSNEHITPSRLSLSLPHGFFFFGSVIFLQRPRIMQNKVPNLSLKTSQ